MKMQISFYQPIGRTALRGLIFMLFVCCLPLSSRAQDNPNRQLVQPAASSGAAARRVALVIGNGAYTNAPGLKNPPNDARDMAATLASLGFDVSRGVNVNQREMKRLIREFGQKLKAGGHGLFYYAGHGVQARGRNFIIPIDAEIQSEADVEDSGVDVGLVLNYMDDAQNGLNIVILDACRNNPFARSFRSASDGLAQVDAPTGTLIAYATAPGRVAADGVGENGLYTSELLKAMKRPGLSATDMFMQVRAEVMKRTGNKQVPWEASSLIGTFYFSPKVLEPRTTSTELTANPAAFELSYWDSVKNSANPEDFAAYLKKYPNGQFADLARNRIALAESIKSSISASSPKASVGSWTLPPVEGDSNCLDDTCKAIRTIVSAAVHEFKPIAGGPVSGGLGHYSNVVLPGFFSARCRVQSQKNGLASSFYSCSYYGQFDGPGAYGKAYEKILSAFGRALPGWMFRSQSLVISEKTWTIAAAGPQECAVPQCPVKLKLIDKNWPDGELIFEVESQSTEPETFPTEAFKKQFETYVRALLDSAPRKFSDLAPAQSFGNYAYCDDPTFTDGTRERRCEMGPLPMGRASVLYEIAKNVIRQQRPNWIIEETPTTFTAKPSANSRGIFLSKFNDGQGSRFWFWVQY